MIMQLTYSNIVHCTENHLAVHLLPVGWYLAVAVASHMTSAEPIKKFYISKVTHQGIEPETSRSREADGGREECDSKKIVSEKNLS